MKPIAYLFLFLTFLVFFGMAQKVFAGGAFNPPANTVTCYANAPPDLHPRTGWRRVEAADQFRIRGLGARGLVKTQYRETLLCNNGKVTEKGLEEYPVFEWWYK